MAAAHAEWLCAPDTAEISRTAAPLLGDAFALQRFLRKHCTPEQAIALAHQIDLRQRAAQRGKLSNLDPHRLVFDRLGLEQATSALPAAAKAEWLLQRLGAGARVADLCCGLGGDALAFAAAGLQVVAVDSNADRLALLSANAHGAGLADRIQPVLSEVRSADDLPDGVSAWHIDPDRRTHDGQRAVSLADAIPGLEVLHALQDRCPAGIIKASPVVRPEELARPCLALVVSVDAELRQLWMLTGKLAEVEGHAPQTLRRGALLLSSPPTGQSAPTQTLFLQTPGRLCIFRQAPQIGPRVFIADTALRHARLAADAAETLGLLAVDPEGQILTGPAIAPAGFGTFDLLHALPAKPDVVAEWMARHSLRAHEVISRLEHASADDWQRQLNQRLARTDAPASVLLVPLWAQGLPRTALICQRHHRRL